MLECTPLGARLGGGCGSGSKGGRTRGNNAGEETQRLHVFFHVDCTVKYLCFSTYLLIHSYTSKQRGRILGRETDGWAEESGSTMTQMYKMPYLVKYILYTKTD